MKNGKINSPSSTCKPSDLKWHTTDRDNWIILNTHLSYFNIEENQMNIFVYIFLSYQIIK